MYLLDTDVVSELRKKEVNIGVREFLAEALADQVPTFISVLTIGELRYGVERMRARGDTEQAARLEAWLATVMTQFGEQLLPVTERIAHVWGALRVRRDDNLVDKLVAATALIHDLTLVTGNVRHFSGLGVRLRNPFAR